MIRTQRLTSINLVPAESGGAAARSTFPYALRILLFFAFQAGLAVLLQQFPELATVHALLTLAIGALILLTSHEPSAFINWMGYLVGSELLWRGLGANVFWETCKLALIGFGALAILKYKPVFKLNWNWLPYFLLLIPSVFLLPGFDREAISFALAGPLATVVLTVFLSGQKIRMEQLKSFLLTGLGAVISFSILILIGIINAETIEFTGSSNFITSANTGPNQVSSLLAFGALCAVLYVMLENEHKFLRAVVFLMAVGFVVQIMLTYSRGGLWTLVAAILAGGIFFLRDQRSRISFTVSAGILIALFYLVLFPALDSWTGNTLSARVSSLDTTGRIEIVRSDLEVFQENPLLGVGVGQSNAYHALYFRVSNAHTEYSRMLAEHGIFGLAALLIMAVLSASKVFEKDDRVSKAVKISCLVWALVFMAHSATRLAAPALLIGLAFSHLDLASPEALKPKSKLPARLRIPVEGRRS
jgi:hypothetical protein